MRAFLKAEARPRAAAGSMARWLAFAGAAAALLAACGGDDGAGTEGPPATPGPAGPEGPPGEQDAPSISAVTPSWAWLSRSETVTISGYDTAWTDGASVDFGAGVTVSDVVVASPTSIVATVTVSDGAAVGPRDVVVTDDGELTSSGGFDVRPGMEVVHVAGDGTQGSFNVFAVSLEDSQHDLTGGIFTTPGMTPFAHTIDGVVQGVHPALGITGEVYYESGWAQVEALIDVNAPTEGPFNLVTTSLSATSTISTGLVTATARTPVELTLGDIADASYGSEPFATHLFEYRNESGDDQLVDLAVSDGTGGEPMAFFYARASGRASDGHVQPTAGLTAGVRDGESVYMMAVAIEGDFGFDFQVLADNERSTTMFASEQADDDACADAQETGIDLVTQQGLVIDGGVFVEGASSLFEGPLGESDWYRFSTSSAATSITCSAHGNHDLVLVQLYASNDCDTPLGSAVDIPAADYYLRVIQVRSATMRGATRYAVVCDVVYGGP